MGRHGGGRAGAGEWSAPRAARVGGRWEIRSLRAHRVRAARHDNGGAVRSGKPEGHRRSDWRRCRSHAVGQYDERGVRQRGWTVRRLLRRIAALPAGRHLSGRRTNPRLGGSHRRRRAAAAAGTSVLIASTVAGREAHNCMDARGSQRLDLRSGGGRSRASMSKAGMRGASGRPTAGASPSRQRSPASKKTHFSSQRTAAVLRIGS